MNADSFSKAREGIERKQADVKEQMQKLAGTYLDLEANRKLIVEAENFISAEQGRCTTEFQDGDGYCNETKDKLAAKLADLMALNEAVKAELKLVSDVQTRAKQVVVDYSTKLKLTKAQNAFETKQLFDNQYKLLLKAKYNGTEKEQHLKEKLATLERKRKLAVKRGDEDAEQDLVETMTSLKEKIQSADANMAASCSRLNELDQEWESFFVPLIPENEQFADLELHDERDAIEVEVQVQHMDEEERIRYEETKEAEAREIKRQADAEELDKKVKVIAERRKMITNGAGGALAGALAGGAIGGPVGAVAGGLLGAMGMGRSRKSSNSEPCTSHPPKVDAGVEYSISGDPSALIDEDRAARAQLMNSASRKRKLPD